MSSRVASPKPTFCIAQVLPFIDSLNSWHDKCILKDRLNYPRYHAICLVALYMNQRKIIFQRRNISVTYSCTKTNFPAILKIICIIFHFAILVVFE